MASVLFNIGRICNSQFKCTYLKNQQDFLNFLFHFWNLNEILNILKKKIMALANVFTKLQTVKNFLTPLCNHSVSIRDTLICRLSKCVLKRRFLESGVTKFFTVCSFGNTLAKANIFFFKMFKISFRFHKWNKKLRKTCWFFR